MTAVRVMKKGSYVWLALLDSMQLSDYTHCRL